MLELTARHQHPAYEEAFSLKSFRYYASADFTAAERSIIEEFGKEFFKDYLSRDPTPFEMDGHLAMLDVTPIDMSNLLDMWLLSESEICSAALCFVCLPLTISQPRCEEVEWIYVGEPD